MAGTITAENRREGGARFRVAFPPVTACDDATGDAVTGLPAPLILGSAHLLARKAAA
jgi:hypothetical protein